MPVAIVTLKPSQAEVFSAETFHKLYSVHDNGSPQNVSQGKYVNLF